MYGGVLCTTYIQPGRDLPIGRSRLTLFPRTRCTIPSSLNNKVTADKVTAGRIWFHIKMLVKAIMDIGTATVHCSHAGSAPTGYSTTICTHSFR